MSQSTASYNARVGRSTGEAIDIETWNRLDHSNPQRILFVRDQEDVLALHTVRMAFADALAAFDAIRNSLHFVSERR